MITLSLNKLKSGMILAEPAHNFQGVLLLDVGAKLTEKNIQILKSWGVTKISVEGKSKRKKRGDSEFENEVSHAIETELKEKFSEVMGDPVMMEIMKVAVNVLEDRSLMKEDEDEEKTH